MKNTKDSPRVFVPPPLFYIGTFLLSLLLQRYVAIGHGSCFNNQTGSLFGTILIGIGLLFMIPALTRFIKSKNTLITVKAANTLQTSGIYSFSRNPMYLGLLFVYSGLALIFGNWWTIILIPFLIFMIIKLIILKEEKYLFRAFGESYTNYKNKVRRWI
jgi:protein-S-isoprenylcysteine O-methyltransferase Ste14